MIWTKPRTLARAASHADLAGLYLFGVASVVGFGVFRVWPELLATPSAMAAYPIAIGIFPRGQIILAFAVLAAFLVRRVGLSWVPALLWVYGISLVSELAGTTVGLPFGPYSYTDALGAMWFGHVPVLIPLSWFTMALPSYVLAGGRGPSVQTRAARTRRVVIASLILLAWDLALDPAMSAATSFWVWGTQGQYYGMPWLNLFGWFVTGLALMGVLSALRVERWTDSLPTGWMAAYYGANLAVPVGLALTAGMWMAIVATAGALAMCWRLVARERARNAVYARVSPAIRPARSIGRVRA